MAIGDGANDVGMITEADLGKGIQGIEGTEASRASDYSISQFSFLQKSLLFHGREAYRRNSFYIIYEFYKNIVFTSPFIYFGFKNFFSGLAFYDALLLQFFDMLYAVLPMFYFAVMDREYDTEIYLERPELYKAGLESFYFNNKIFWKNVILGFIEGLMITLNCCYFYEIDNFGYSDDDIISLGVIVFSGVVICVNIKVLLRVCIIDYILVFFVAMSIIFLYFTIIMFSSKEFNDIIDFSALLGELADNCDVYGTNEQLINKKKYFMFFVFTVFFTCFLDIAANRINFKYLLNAFNENKSFFLFETDKYLIDGINRGVFPNENEGNENDDKERIFIDDDRELLKNQNNKIEKKVNFNNSINEIDENDLK